MGAWHANVTRSSPYDSLMDRALAAGALGAEYALLVELTRDLTQDELVAPSGCRGWTVADLLFHMLLDAQRALVTFHSPVAGPADTDFVGYWKGFSSDVDAARAHARFVRLSAAAHADERRIVSRWEETARAALRACEATAAAFVTTQGHVLATGDFVATLVVEATVHHLDLTAHLRDKPPPVPQALAVTTATLDGLLDGPRPDAWDDLAYIRKATGRAALADDDRAALGDAANRLPLFS
jgi:uncharacterized protein (TIGR03083 family)